MNPYLLGLDLINGAIVVTIGGITILVILALYLSMKRETQIRKVG
jgi:hypothetical protein